MKKELLTFAALQAIAAANLEGFTVNKESLQPITAGYSVAVAGTQNSFNAAGLKRVIKYAKEHKEINAFGGWYNTENKKFYFDAVIVCNTLEEAITLGRANNQIAIFNLNTFEEIRLQSGPLLYV